MEYKYDEIGAQHIEEIATGIMEMYKNQEEREKDEIKAKKMDWRKKDRAYKEIKEKYARIRGKDPILTLNRKLQEMKKIADKKHELDKAYDLIKATGNEKSIKEIEKEISKYKKEHSKIYFEAKEIMSEKEIKRPAFAHEEDKVKYVTKDKDGGYYIADTYMGGPDAYGNVIATAFSNELNDIDRSKYEDKVSEKDDMSYVEQEMEEITDLEKFWGTKKFSDYVEKLEEKDPKKAQQYKQAQIKRRQETNKIKALYEELATTRASKEKIQNALYELRKKKDYLPEKTYKKIEKKLLAQQAKETKKSIKLEAKVQKAKDKLSINYSINNAKRYADAQAELDSLSSRETLEDLLASKEESLEEAEMELREQEEIDRTELVQGKVTIAGGDVRESRSR